MMKLRAKMKALNASAVASDDERAAIRLLLEHAQQILPGTRVRFVQRDEDVVGTLLIVSLVSPKFDDPQNYALHAIAHELDEHNDINVIVTQSSTPELDKQLLKISSFVPADELSADLKEPMHYNIFFRPAHQMMWEEGKVTKFILIVGGSMLLTYFVYLPLSELAQTKFPQIFGRDLVRTKFDRRIGFVRLTVDDAIKEIDGEIKKLTLTKEQVRELEADKVILEKASKDLGESEASSK